MATGLLIREAGNMIDKVIGLTMLNQLLNEGLKASVLGRQAPTSNDKNVLHTQGLHSSNTITLLYHKSSQSFRDKVNLNKSAKQFERLKFLRIFKKIFYNSRTHIPASGKSRINSQRGIPKEDKDSKPAF
ncbi:hypothetical protein HMPREF1557_01806 [Streptococcus sobrinus W1703]|uniref:Uncharacterized protein n=1 Tax=Streptococcus sobrinus W1703 TaxID=1227275 RepID=U2IJZ4_9STRE|nr:hypothetical protein HMPREF1557_01806 [Streptococcus sobrinus W1703]